MLSLKNASACCIWLQFSTVPLIDSLCNIKQAWAILLTSLRAATSNGLGHWLWPCWGSECHWHQFRNVRRTVITSRGSTLSVEPQGMKSAFSNNDSSQNGHSKHGQNGELLYALPERVSIPKHILLEGKDHNFRQRCQEYMEDRKVVAWRDENKMWAIVFCSRLLWFYWQVHRRYQKGNRFSEYPILHSPQHIKSQHIAPSVLGWVGLSYCVLLHVVKGD